MKSAMISILLFALLGQPSAYQEAPTPRQANRSKRQQLLELYTDEAAGYTIYRDDTRKVKLELRREPVYVWKNQVRNGEQDGAVFVWTDRGRAEVIGTFFSFPPNGTRDLCHEFHSLSLSVLDVNRSPRANRWTPGAPGIHPAPIEGSPKPAALGPATARADARTGP